MMDGIVYLPILQDTEIMFHFINQSTFPTKAPIHMVGTVHDWLTGGHIIHNILLLRRVVVCSIHFWGTLPQQRVLRWAHLRGSFVKGYGLFPMQRFLPKGSSYEICWARQGSPLTVFVHRKFGETNWLIQTKQNFCLYRLMLTRNSAKAEN